MCQDMSLISATNNESILKDEMDDEIHNTGDIIADNIDEEEDDDEDDDDIESSSHGAINSSFPKTSNPAFSKRPEKAKWTEEEVTSDVSIQPHAFISAIQSYGNVTLF